MPLHITFEQKSLNVFFFEFQESFEKLMQSYIGTRIDNKPAWMNFKYKKLN